jgi:membrane-associated protease RseP (regulator of RpoE activity)
LKAGDVITAVDGEKVNSPGDVSRAINKKQEGSITLTVVRDRSPRSVTVTPEKISATTMGDLRTIVVPRIEIPVIPAINVQIPQIVVPTTPEVNVVVPRRAVRVIRSSRGVII